MAYKEHLIEHMGDENVNMAQSADNKNIKNEFVKKVVAPAKVSFKMHFFEQVDVYLQMSRRKLTKYYDSSYVTNGMKI